MRKANERGRIEKETPEIFSHAQLTEHTADGIKDDSQCTKCHFSFENAPEALHSDINI